MGDTDRFVRMYVNDYTMDMGVDGEKSIRYYLRWVMKGVYYPSLNYYLSNLTTTPRLANPSISSRDSPSSVKISTVFSPSLGALPPRVFGLASFIRNGFRKSFSLNPPLAIN